MIELGVNIDHIATVRQARQTVEPDPVRAAALAEFGGADGITVHLREDRRHINDRDVRLLRATIRAKLNLEMACSEEITQIACEVEPDQVTLVPEKRNEITTEGGLDILASLENTTRTVAKLKEKGIFVSAFLDPEPKQIEAAQKIGFDAVELHTGTYANATTDRQQRDEIRRLTEGAKIVSDLGMRLHGGHGLTYHNVLPIAHIPKMFELNIGHSIVSRAVYVGLQQAVADMKALINTPPY